MALHEYDLHVWRTVVLYCDSGTTASMGVYVCTVHCSVGELLISTRWLSILIRSQIANKCVNDPELVPNVFRLPKYSVILLLCFECRFLQLRNTIVGSWDENIILFFTCLKACQAECLFWFRTTQSYIWKVERHTSKVVLMKLFLLHFKLLTLFGQYKWFVEVTYTVANVNPSHYFLYSHCVCVGVHFVLLADPCGPAPIVLFHCLD